jgi:hypothetical protein
MNAKLREIDTKGQILANDLKHGRITFEQWADRNRKLIDRAEAIMARQAARA